jgi:hypothetical protein
MNYVKSLGSAIYNGTAFAGSEIYRIGAEGYDDMKKILWETRGMFTLT